MTNQRGRGAGLATIVAGLAFFGGAAWIELHDSERFELSLALLFWVLALAGLLSLAVGLAWCIHPGDHMRSRQ